MKLKLRAKGFKQESEMSCGAAALRSILDFSGKSMSEPEIIHDSGGIINDESYCGILTIHAAVALHKMGFKVHAYSYNMKLLKPGWSNIKSTALIKHIEALKEKLTKARKKTSTNITESMVYLLKNKQDFKIKFPEKEDILGFLEKKLPVLISVWAKTIYGTSDPLAIGGHYLVVIGYDGKNFLVLDPYDGREHSIDESLLLLAWCNNALDSTDFLLAIEPEKATRHSHH